MHRKSVILINAIILTIGGIPGNSGSTRAFYFHPWGWSRHACAQVRGFVPHHDGSGSGDAPFNDPFYCRYIEEPSF
ncbi:hypothetical protein [Pedobacter sp. SYSU D00535]|uniref:hypothetical protein n=1 Tax=Pedobacter sp. SYSU D00535 TaxID=2810308 RepID=UPI001A97ADF9|nr:hypothetical protein [Pedobacter sp. SYSU D00535]